MAYRENAPLLLPPQQQPYHSPAQHAAGLRPEGTSLRLLSGDGPLETTARQAGGLAVAISFVRNAPSNAFYLSVGFGGVNMLREIALFTQHNQPQTYITFPWSTNQDRRLQFQLLTHLKVSVASPTEFNLPPAIGSQGFSATIPVAGAEVGLVVLSLSPAGAPIARLAVQSAPSPVNTGSSSPQLCPTTVQLMELEIAFAQQLHYDGSLAKETVMCDIVDERDGAVVTRVGTPSTLEAVQRMSGDSFFLFKWLSQCEWAFVRRHTYKLVVYASTSLQAAGAPLAVSEAFSISGSAGRQIMIMLPLMVQGKVAGEAKLRIQLRDNIAQSPRSDRSLVESCHKLDHVTIVGNGSSPSVPLPQSQSTKQGTIATTGKTDTPVAIAVYLCGVPPLPIADTGNPCNLRLRLNVGDDTFEAPFWSSSTPFRPQLVNLPMRGYKHLSIIVEKERRGCRDWKVCAASSWTLKHLLERITPGSECVKQLGLPNLAQTIQVSVRPSNQAEAFITQHPARKSVPIAAGENTKNHHFGAVDGPQQAIPPPPVGLVMFEHLRVEEVYDIDCPISEISLVIELTSRTTGETKPQLRLRCSDGGSGRGYLQFDPPAETSMTWTGQPFLRFLVVKQSLSGPGVLAKSLWNLEASLKKCPQSQRLSKILSMCGRTNAPIPYRLILTLHARASIPLRTTAAAPIPTPSVAPAIPYSLSAGSNDGRNTSNIATTATLSTVSAAVCETAGPGTAGTVANATVATTTSSPTSLEPPPSLLQRGSSRTEPATTVSIENPRCTDETMPPVSSDNIETAAVDARGSTLVSPSFGAVDANFSFFDHTQPQLPPAAARVESCQRLASNSSLTQSRLVSEDLAEFDFAVSKMRDFSAAILHLDTLDRLGTWPKSRQCVLQILCGKAAASSCQLAASRLVFGREQVRVPLAPGQTSLDIYAVLLRPSKGSDDKAPRVICKGCLDLTVASAVFPDRIRMQVPMPLMDREGNVIDRAGLVPCLTCTAELELLLEDGAEGDEHITLVDWGRSSSSREPGSNLIDTEACTNVPDGTRDSNTRDSAINTTPTTHACPDLTPPTDQVDSIDSSAASVEIAPPDVAAEDLCGSKGSDDDKAHHLSGKFSCDLSGNLPAPSTSVTPLHPLSSDEAPSMSLSSSKSMIAAESNDSSAVSSGERRRISSERINGDNSANGGDGLSCEVHSDCKDDLAQPSLAGSGTGLTCEQKATSLQPGNAEIDTGTVEIVPDSQAVVQNERGNSPRSETMPVQGICDITTATQAAATEAGSPH